MDMTFKLQVFEGPLDLLLYLIEKNKVNIYDIPIVEITAQYMEYVDQMKKDNLDTLSEFLVMAATLLDIKSKMLLPKKEEEEQEQEDPRAELVQQLLEYKMYKCMANELKDRQLDAGKVWYKKKDIPDKVLAYEEPVNLEELVGDIRLSDLNRIFQSIMKRQEEKIDKVRSKFGKIEKEEVSLEEKMEYLTDYAASHKHFSFRGLLTASSSKVEVIVTFLAILELMKTGKLTIVQEHIFDDITATPSTTRSRPCTSPPSRCTCPTFRSARSSATCPSPRPPASRRSAATALRATPWPSICWQSSSPRTSNASRMEPRANRKGR